MSTETFKYKGKEFTPLRKFNRNESFDNESWIRMLGPYPATLCSADWNWNDFMDAATAKVDIYRCEFDNNYYIPCSCGLMLCTNLTASGEYKSTKTI